MGSIPLMELLLSNNANINIPGGHERMTVLHEAVLNDKPDETIIKFLLENGADSQIKYAFGVRLFISFLRWIETRMVNRHPISHWLRRIPSWCPSFKPFNVNTLLTMIFLSFHLCVDVSEPPPPHTHSSSLVSTRHAKNLWWNLSKPPSAGRRWATRKTWKIMVRLLFLSFVADLSSFQSLTSLLVVKPIELLFEPSTISVGSCWANGFWPSNVSSERSLLAVRHGCSSRDRRMHQTEAMGRRERLWNSRFTVGTQLARMSNQSNETWTKREMIELSSPGPVHRLRSSRKVSSSINANSSSTDNFILIRKKILSI